jgi:hypothetical protein
MYFLINPLHHMHAISSCCVFYSNTVFHVVSRSGNSLSENLGLNAGDIENGGKEEDFTLGNYGNIATKLF